MKKRLTKLCDLVEGQVVADIGCDHGFLCQMLIEKGISDLYACEVTEKNLNKARKNIENFLHNTKRIKSQNIEKIEYDGGSVTFKLSDGFKNLQNSFECAIIAGMGGELILDIILFDKTKMPEILVLQPMSKVEKLREQLSQHYEFVVDEVIFDNGKFYNCLKLKKGKDNLTSEEILFGRTNLIEKSGDFKNYLRTKKEQLKKANVIKFQEMICHIEKVEENI